MLIKKSKLQVGLNFLSQFFYNSPKDVYIPKECLQINYCRSQGPGGQNVNKTNSKAEIRMHIESQSWLNEHQKLKLREQYAQYINNEGEIIVTCQTEREQNRNLEGAMKKIQQMIFQASVVQKERRFDIPSETENMAFRRIDNKRKRSEVKSLRRLTDD